MIITLNRSRRFCDRTDWFWFNRTGTKRFEPSVWNNKHVLFNNIQLKRNQIKNLIIVVQDFEIFYFFQKKVPHLILFWSLPVRFSIFRFTPILNPRKKMTHGPWVVPVMISRYNNFLPFMIKTDFENAYINFGHFRFDLQVTSGFLGILALDKK